MDPRISMGMQVEEAVHPPFTTRRAVHVDPQTGGMLDVAIVARTAEGYEVIIGEIWAAAPSRGGMKVRLDAQKIAEGICEILNRQAGARA